MKFTLRHVIANLSFLCVCMAATRLPGVLGIWLPVVLGFGYAGYVLGGTKGVAWALFYGMMIGTYFCMPVVQ